MRTLLRGLTLGAAAMLSAGLAGCRAGSAGRQGTTEVAGKTYRLRGKVVAKDAARHTVTVDHRAIPGFMDAMTMPYKVEDPSTLEELHPGDIITARIRVADSPEGPVNARLDEIVVVAQANPNAMPAVKYHVPAVGEEVPDFALLNQSGKVIHLRGFRGKAVLLTFIYTRCPLADFCPRMSENFAAIDKALAADKKVYGETHLVSVSFDPKYDTPTVLRSYGGAHTGRFTDEDFRHWDFAAPPVAELGKVEQWFDVGVTGTAGEAGGIQHSLSTVLIGKDGKVVAWWPTNDWKVGDVLERVKAAAGA